MVTSAHEVSDGIQEASKDTGEGLKTAVEKKPEIAVPIVKSVIAPVQCAVVACFVAIAGLLLWLLWPCVQLVRIAISLAASRKAAEMNSRCHARMPIAPDVHEHGAQAEPPTRSHQRAMGSRH